MTVSPSISTAAGTTSPAVVGTGTSATRTAATSLTVNTPSVIRAAFYYPWFPDTGRDPTVTRTPTTSRPAATTAPTLPRCRPDRGHAVRGRDARPRLLVRADLEHREALARDHAGRPRHRLQPGRRTTSRKAPPTRRRSRSPTTSTTCAAPTAARDRRWRRCRARACRCSSTTPTTRRTPRAAHGEPVEAGQRAAPAAVRRVGLRRPQGVPAATRPAPTSADRRLAPVRTRERRAGLLHRSRRRRRSQSRPGTGRPAPPTAPRPSSPATSPAGRATSQR